jgi:hypothetical protein
MEHELFEGTISDASASAARLDQSGAGADAGVLGVRRTIAAHARHVAVEQG